MAPLTSKTRSTPGPAGANQAASGSSLAGRRVPFRRILMSAIAGQNKGREGCRLKDIQGYLKSEVRSVGPGVLKGLAMALKRAENDGMVAATSKGTYRLTATGRRTAKTVDVAGRRKGALRESDIHMLERRRRRRRRGRGRKGRKGRKGRRRRRRRRGRKGRGKRRSSRRRRVNPARR